MTKGNLAKEFWDYANSCLAKCEEYCSKDHDFEDYLQYRIENVEEAYERYKERRQREIDLERLKDLAYQYHEETNQEGNFFGTPFYKWLCQQIPPSEGQFCYISPEKLMEEAGWQDGDELWKWSTPKETWEAMFGRAGYAVLRDGEVIWSRITEEN